MSSDVDFNGFRSEMHDAISEIVQRHLDGTFGITGWIMVCESLDNDGDRQLTVMSGDALADNTLPFWTIRGWLAHAEEELGDLYFDPNFEDGIDEEDDDD